MSQNIWIMSANAARAYIYQVDNKSFLNGKIKLHLLETYEHPESRKKDTDLVSDRLGRYSSSATGGRGAFESRTDPKKHEADVFAKQLADILNSAKESQVYSDLILIIPAHFLGLMRKHINGNILNSVRTVIEKDYTQTPILELTKHIKEHLLSL